MHGTRSQITEELAACIRCNECLRACPALPLPIAIETLNHETLSNRISPNVARFAKACYQCGACVPVCPAGLHRDMMMLWLKMRLARGGLGDIASEEPGASGAHPIGYSTSAWRQERTSPHAQIEPIGQWE